VIYTAISGLEKFPWSTFLASESVSYIFWIISGVLMIFSIASIKKYLRWRGAEDGTVLNFAQIRRHIIAFGLLLFSVVVA